MSGFARIYGQLVAMVMQLVIKALVVALTLLAKLVLALGVLGFRLCIQYVTREAARALPDLEQEAHLRLSEARALVARRQWSSSLGPRAELAGDGVPAGDGIAAEARGAAVPTPVSLTKTPREAVGVARTAGVETRETGGVPPLPWP